MKITATLPDRHVYFHWRGCAEGAWESAMKGSSGGMAATQTASRADAVAWIPMRWSKALDDAVAAPHQPAPSADERRSPKRPGRRPNHGRTVYRVTLSHL